MKRTRFTEERIAFALKQQELGSSVDKICRSWALRRRRLAPKALEPARRRELVDDLQAKYGASQSQACAVMMISRSVYTVSIQAGRIRSRW